MYNRQQQYLHLLFNRTCVNIENLMCIKHFDIIKKEYCLKNRISLFFIAFIILFFPLKLSVKLIKNIQKRFEKRKKMYLIEFIQVENL